MAAIDKQALKDAVTRRSSYILENKETITMNQCRKMLEEDMGLPEKSLKGEKEYVKELIDKVFTSNAAAEEPAAPSEGAAPAGKEYGREVQKLKRTCKLASITVPPSVYTRVTEEQDVVDRLKALLQKHGLSEQATSDEIAQVRKDLQKQRDLEGIDMNNILGEGRGRRAAAAAPRKYNYADSGNSSDSDAEDENADEENAQPANGSPGNKKQEQKKASGISEGSDASDTNGEDAYDSNFSGMSQPSDGGTDKEEDSKPGALDKTSSDLMMKKTTKRKLAQWSDDDD
ncbi:hypothetical protein WJX75_004933 [Coccomyxa subellipsoidea]|uniref:DEK C-terminal domain-containing protein n=1 Tax=Coccomyxa subellipsoidea TaxID=248742 RepID=A0ABR2YY99_9CHLO